MTPSEPAGTEDRPRPPWTGYPGPALRLAGDYAWRLLAVGTVVYFGVQLLSRLSEVVIPFVVSILVTALLYPLAQRMRRVGISRGLATVLTMLGTVVILGGLGTIVVVRAAQQAPQLGNEINNLLPHLKHWLIHGPLKINPKTVNNLNDTISQDITKNSKAIASTALSTGKTVLSLLAGTVLAIFSTVFLVHDGDRVWAFLLKGVPAAARPAVNAAATAAWSTISFYIRGTFIVALFHGVVVAVTLTILGVPLAFPLAVLVALGSFVPLVGAVITGVLAVAVAGVSKGLIAAAVMTAVLLLDNQIETHVLQPFVVGRYVRIHPLAVVLSLAAGGLLFGIVGAVIAVPVAATLNSAVRAAVAVQNRTHHPPAAPDLPAVHGPPVAPSGPSPADAGQGNGEARLGLADPPGEGE